MLDGFGGIECVLAILQQMVEFDVFRREAIPIALTIIFSDRHDRVQRRSIVTANMAAMREITFLEFLRREQKS